MRDLGSGMVTNCRDLSRHPSLSHLPGEKPHLLRSAEPIPLFQVKDALLYGRDISAPELQSCLVSVVDLVQVFLIGSFD